MKSRKNWKRFWTLNRHHAEGFTLVELIVVIAILAILGGVAIPAYSGYVAKAERAGDEQLLAAVNQAFAAACIENGVDVHMIDNAAMEINPMKVTSVAGGNATNYNAAFQKYFAGNEATEFAVIDSIVFDALLHSFIDVASETVNIYFAGTYVALSGEDIQNLKDSSFANIGADKLLAMVDMAAGLIDITKVDSSTLAQLATSEEAMNFFFTKLGVTSKMELAPTLMSKYPQGDMTDDEYNAFLDEKYNQMVANSAVLYAAQNSQAVSEGIWDVLKSESVKDTIKSNANAEEQLAQSAMAFAMYSAYTKTDSLEGVELNDVYSTLDSKEFKAYLETEQAKNDLNGYLSSMNMVNDGVSSGTSAAQDILLNGFSSEELEALMGQLVGNK